MKNEKKEIEEEKNQDLGGRGWMGVKTRRARERMKV